jgi:uncharacterized protein YxeA
MKKILSGLLYLIATTASAIQVTGEGSTFEEAKQNAFKTAIEFEAGAVVVSERESNNYKLVRNEILVYSSGYITDYKIINTIRQGNHVKVLVDVQVASNKLADRILGVGKDAKIFDTDKHSNQYNSYLQGKQNGDRLLQQLLNDYPKKAYNLTQGVHQLKVDVNRNGIIEIPLELRWNYKFIESFNEALKILQDGSNGLLQASPSNVTVMAKDPKDWVIGSKNQYKFNDMNTVSVITQTLQNNQPRILVSIKNLNNKIAFQQCYIPDSISGKKPAFYDASNHVVLYGNRIEKNKIQLNFVNMHEVIKEIQSIELNIVADNNCP